jgi:hypothetical protein
VDEQRERRTAGPDPARADARRRPRRGRTLPTVHRQRHASVAADDRFARLDVAELTIALATKEPYARTAARRMLPRGSIGPGIGPCSRTVATLLGPGIGFVRMPAPIDVPVGAVPEGWQHARLIPTFGIRNQQEQEKRATSCLLAVMHGVPEFGHALLSELDAPKAPIIETFAEVRFKDSNGKTVIPDGAIVCRWGKKIWTCLVEVKTGSAKLKDEQVAAYLDIAKANGFDGVLTISTQITANSSESPCSVDRRKLRGNLGLWHVSWWRVLTEAVVQQRYRGISDPDQEWVLRELIHYLGSEASGAVGFEDMGERWVAVRKAAHGGTLRAGDPAAHDVAERWEQFTNYLCLSLSQELGATITAARPRSQTTTERLEELVKSLANDGLLSSTLRVPDAAGPLTIRSDLRSRQTFISTTIAAPREKRPKTSINWLLRQLREAADDLLIEVAYPNARETTAASLGEVRDDSSRLLYPSDPKRDPRRFIVTQARPMGQKRGRAEGSFVRETSAQTVGFYRDIVQDLKPWQPKPPKLRTEAETASESTPTESVVVPAWVGEQVATPSLDGGASADLSPESVP